MSPRPLIALSSRRRPGRLFRRWAVWTLAALVSCLAVAQTAPPVPPPAAPPTASPTASPPASPPRSGEDERPVAPPKTLGPTSAAPSVPTAALTAEHIAALKKTLLEQNPEGGEAVTQVAEAYDRALAALEAARGWREKSETFERNRQASIEERAATEQRLALPAVPDVTVAADATLEQMKQERDQADATLTDARKALERIDSERTLREQRRSEIPAQRTELQGQLETLNAAAASAPPADASPELVQARRQEQLALRQAVEAQLAALAAEIANYDARVELLPKRRELAQRRVVEAERIAKQWRDLVNDREKRVAEEKARAAREAVAALSQATPTLQEVAASNLALAEQRTGPNGILARKTVAQQDVEQLEATLADFRSRFEIAKERSRLAGLRDLTGIRLRRERNDLPEPRSIRQRIRDRGEEIAGAQVMLADLEFELDQLPPLVVDREQRMAALDPNLDPIVRTQIEAELESQLQEQRAKYTSLVDDYRSYVVSPGWLLRAQEADQQLLEVTSAYRTFIDERILWIRSGSAARLEDFTHAGQELKRMFAWDAWREVGRTLETNFLARPWTTGMLGFLVFVLLALRPYIKKRLRAIAQDVRGLVADRFVLTVQAGYLTVLLALPLPLFFWLLARQLAMGEGELVTLMAAGFDRIAFVVAPLTLLRQLVRTNGLGDVHFNWRPRTRRLISNSLRWFVPSIVPLVFVINASHWESGDVSGVALARLAFVAAMILLAVFVARTVDPYRDGVMKGVLASRQDGWLDRLKGIWFPAIVLLPIALAALTLGGYLYTAINLERSLFSTFWLLLALVIAGGFFLRWLVQVRRRLATPESSTTEGTATPALDLNSIDTQARQLLRTGLIVSFAVGLWLIWFNMLPALSVLERVELWPDLRIRSDIVETATLSMPSPPVAETVNNAAEPTAESPGMDPSNMFAMPASSAKPDAVGNVVTLANAIVAFAIVVMTVIISTNLPGLLEIVVLRRLPLEASARFAIATIARYLVTILGIGLAFGAVGIGWAKVQWLAAAITVGLGFGLQEIFANFVSGLILLFEQPIRVGDTVTVGDTSGRVSRIQIRATTIVDWDRKEMIIPNKTFVTGQIVNWSLSDSILRLKIPVGVAYGSDTERAKRILLDLARQHPDVLADPAPMAFFLQFADSSLNLELRVFIPHIDRFMHVRDSLHAQIDRAFRQAGIEIAFPQRDLHIRSVASGTEFTVPAASETPVNA